MSVLMLETLDQSAMDKLNHLHDLVMSPDPNARSHDLPFNGVEAIITRGLGRIDAQLMAACPKLKVIARAGAGLNNLDLDAAKATGIKVVFAPGLNAAAVAEHTLMLMLNCLRRGPRASREVKSGNWDYRETYEGDDLRGKSVGIIGSGSIGRRVADLCRAFSMDVFMISRDGEGHDHLIKQLGSVASSLDLISLHLPLNDETEGMINGDIIRLCKSGVVLINTSRGGLIDENDICDGLNNGAIGFYAADVMAVQPPQKNNSLIAHENCAVTPHMASLTKQTWAETSNFIADNVSAILQNKQPAPLSIYAGTA
ncbi:MAG: NAD(P)-dependent oxidoreductase [Sneathiella sp.]|uniref:NAD(P)-dependent oxidoreductase n=1 Tax=Sneathiella sp. TaxID=1964365 RepID=UPI00300212ED